VTSSRQVWLAGLGALAKAQDEGSEALERLVQRGHEIERRLQQEAAARAAQPRKGAPRGVEKLGRVFEQRVAEAVDRLGLRPAVDVRALEARVETLAAQVEALRRRSNADRAPSKQSARAPRDR
jgi:poly(hydroxyalkanoate) granule-associated protein